MHGYTQFLIHGEKLVVLAVGAGYVGGVAYLSAILRVIFIPGIGFRQAEAYFIGRERYGRYIGLYREAFASRIGYFHICIRCSR